MADILTSTVNGSIQRYVNRKWYNQPRRKFLTPLANHAIGVPGMIPKNSGQKMEFRKFRDFPVPDNGTTDSPKIFKETDGDPSTGQDLSSVTVEIPLAAIRDFATIGKMVSMTDPIELTRLIRDLFNTQQMRWVHRWCNDSFVIKIVDENSFGATPISDPFKTIFAQRAYNYAQLTREAVFETADFKRARAILMNRKVPMAFPEQNLYAAFVDDAIISQLESDPNFKEAVLRGWKTTEVLGKAEFVDIYGMRFILQNDEYRSALGGAQGGSHTVRNDSGAVHTAHVIGAHAFAYLDLGNKKNRTTTAFKVQDITTTGVRTSIGWDIPFRTSVIDNEFGLNIAGCTNYDETLDDIA